MAGHPYWTCPALAFTLSGGLAEPTASAVTAATAVTLLRMLLDHHGSVPRRPWPGAGAAARREFGETIMVGDLVISRITHLAGATGGEVGGGVLTHSVDLMATTVRDRAARYLPDGRYGVDREIVLVNHPLVRAALGISRACRPR